MAARRLAKLSLLLVGALAEESAVPPETKTEEAVPASSDAARTTYGGAAAAPQVQARPPVASAPATPPPPPVFDNAAEEERQKNAAIETLKHQLSLLQVQEEVNAPDLREAVRRAERLGIKSQDVLEANRALQENAKKMLDRAVEHKGDVLVDHMHMLTSAVNQAMMDGHDGPQVAVARKMRNDKIAAAIDAASRGEDLEALHKYIYHAKIHARGELDSVVAMHEKTLHSKAAMAVSQHHSVGEKDHTALRAAIQVCRAEGIESEYLDEAEATYEKQEKRSIIRQSLPTYNKETDLEALSEHVKIAQRYNLTDPEIQAAIKFVHDHVRNMASEVLKPAAARTVRRLVEGPNGTTVEVEEPDPNAEPIGLGELHRAIHFGREHGVSEMDLEPLKKEIATRAKSRLSAAMSRPATGPDRMNALEELMAAHNAAGLTETDKQAALASAQSQVKAALADASGMGWTSKPGAFGNFAEILVLAGRGDVELSDEVVEPYVKTFVEAATKEMEAAADSKDRDRLFAITSARSTIRALFNHRFVDMQDTAWHHADARSNEAMERAFRKHSILSDLERLAEIGPDAAAEMRGHLADCEREGLCDAAERATWESRISALGRGTPSAAASTYSTGASGAAGL